MVKDTCLSGKSQNPLSYLPPLVTDMQGETTANFWMGVVRGKEAATPPGLDNRSNW